MRSIRVVLAVSVREQRRQESQHQRGSLPSGMPTVGHPDCLIGIQTQCRETPTAFIFRTIRLTCLGKTRSAVRSSTCCSMLVAVACDTHENIHFSRAGNILVFVDISQQNEQALYTHSLTPHTNRRYQRRVAKLMRSQAACAVLVPYRSSRIVL